MFGYVVLYMYTLTPRSTANTKGLEELRVANQFNCRYLGSAIGQYITHKLKWEKKEEKEEGRKNYLLPFLENKICSLN